MTTFEIIILMALYPFAFSYMAHWFCGSLSNKDNTWIDVAISILAAGTIGIVYFPLILAEDIWNKLNKKK